MTLPTQPKRAPRFSGIRIFAATARNDGDSVELAVSAGARCRSTEGVESYDARRRLVANIGDWLVVSAHDVADYDGVSCLEIVRVEPMRCRKLGGVVRDGRAWVMAAQTAVARDRRAKARREIAARRAA